MLSVPVGACREKHQKIMWLRESASETEVRSKIRDLFCWKSTSAVQFMYASGRHLRPSSLKDVENATSWDCNAIKALMGSGCLYVCKYEDSSEEEEVRAD